jgi:hypothetical protein
MDMKNNNCIITFSCVDPMNSSCVYFKDNNSICKYAEQYKTINIYYCRSNIACVNKMNITLNSLLKK